MDNELLNSSLSAIPKLVCDTKSNAISKIAEINISSPFNTYNTTSAWTTGYVSVDDNTITSNIPSIFTISKITKKSPKILLIQYDSININLCPLAPEGNIYISGAKVFGIYNHSDNYYWNNKLIVEFETEEDLSKVTEGNTFTNATQWEKKLTVQEVINMLEDKDIYYKYIHSQVEEAVKGQLLTTKIEKHKSIDKLYGFEE